MKFRNVVMNYCFILVALGGIINVISSWYFNIYVFIFEIIMFVIAIILFIILIFLDFVFDYIW
jgi:hypothetical protein